MPSIRGEQVVSDRLKFFEAKRQLRVTEPVGSDSAHQYSLVAAAISHELLLVGSQHDCSVKALNPGKLMNQPDDPNQVLYSLQLGFKPLQLSVSQHGFGSVLLVAGKNEQNNCPVVQFFDLNGRESIGRVDVPSQTNSDIVETEWNPIYHDSIVAMCTSTGCLLVMALCKDTRRAGLVYQDSKYGVLSCSWSPKGKNLAVGMANGQIMRLEPVISDSSFTFKDVSNSTVNPANEALTPQHRIVKLNWCRQKILLCVHAKLGDPNGPETVYSLVSIKASDPLVFWTGVCSERCDTNCSYFPANLNNIIVCASSSSSEVVVLGPKSGEAGADKIPDWSTVLIDEEGCRIDLPLDSKNNETYALGITVTFLSNDPAKKPILILYTSAGVICPYICESATPLSLPSLLAPQASPLQNIPQPPQLQPQQLTPPPQPASPAPPIFQSPQPSVLSSPQSMFKSFESSSIFSPSQLAPKTPQTPTITPISPPSVAVKEVPKEEKRIGIKIDFPKEIAAIKDGIQYNSVYLTLLDDINHIRSQLDEIIDIHKMHTDALDAIREDIDSLDLGMLENFYLIEFIKSRSKNSAKKSFDPLTSKRLDTMKKKMKTIEKKLEDLELQVDVSWEDHIRRTKKKPSLNSLDIIYKSLSTNQKILNLLKKKASTRTIQSETSCEVVQETKELDPAKMKALREFLASRNTVPVRRPIKLK